MEGKIKGKQIADGTVVKSLNGSLDSSQYLIPSNDSNITLDIVTPLDSSTHSFVVGWQGHLPLERGGLNNSDFSESEILITKTSSVISSGYRFNDQGNTSVDIWSANQIVTYIKSTKSVFNIGDGESNAFHLVHNSGTKSRRKRSVPNCASMFAPQAASRSGCSCQKLRNALNPLMPNGVGFPYSSSHLLALFHSRAN